MKYLPWLLCVLLVGNTVSAQESSTQSPPAKAESTLAPLVIEVRAQRISRSALSESLLKELQRDPTASGEAKPEGALELSDAAGDTVRLTYRDATGRETTRDLYLAPDDPEALDKITIAAANLVRDQMGVLAQLESERRAEEDAALKALEKPAERTALPAPPVVKPVAPAYDPCHPPVTTPFGVDLAWLVGTSSTAFGRQAARRVSLGFLGTYSGGTQGIELAIGGNIDQLGTCGVQAAAGFNISLGDVKGLQLAVLNGAIGKVRGAQLGIVNFSHRSVHGLQLGITNVSFDAASVQLGVANIAIGGTEAQLGVLNVSAGKTRAQLGVANLNWGSTQEQIGVLNVAKDYARSQFGVVNYAGRARAPIGLISIVRDGHTTLDAWANENGALFGMLTHGGDRVYNMYGVGTRVEKGGSRLALAWGLAARLYSDPRFRLDWQVLSEFYPRVSPWRSHVTTSRLRLAADVRITARISALLAVGYAVAQVEYGSSQGVQAPFGETEFRKARDQKGKRLSINGFPSFGLGLRVLLSNPNKPRQ